MTWFSRQVRLYAPLAWLAGVDRWLVVFVLGTAAASLVLPLSNHPGWLTLLENTRWRGTSPHDPFSDLWGVKLEAAVNTTRWFVRSWQGLHSLLLLSLVATTAIRTRGRRWKRRELLVVGGIFLGLASATTFATTQIPARQMRNLPVQQSAWDWYSACRSLDRARESAPDRSVQLLMHPEDQYERSTYLTPREVALRLTEACNTPVAPEELVLEPYESADTADTADVVPTPWASPHFPTVPFSSVILPRSHALNPILRMQLQWPMYTLFQCFVVAIALISPFLVTSRSPPGKWERKYRRQALTQVALTLATVAAIVLALEDLIENLDVADTVLFASLILLPVLLLWPIGPDRVGRLRWQSIRFGIFLTLCVMLSWEEGGIGYTSPLFVANTIEENRLVAEHTSIFWAAISAAYLGFTTLRITAHPK